MLTLRKIMNLKIETRDFFPFLHFIGSKNDKSGLLVEMEV